MTVKELKEKLKNLPDDVQIIVDGKPEFVIYNIPCRGVTCFIGFDSEILNMVNYEKL